MYLIQIKHTQIKIPLCSFWTVRLVQVRNFWMASPLRLVQFLIRLFQRPTSSDQLVPFSSSWLSSAGPGPSPLAPGSQARSQKLTCIDVEKTRTYLLLDVLRQQVPVIWSYADIR
jgi:hypothetical protein